MATKKYSRQSIVEGSEAAREHEEMMNGILSRGDSGVRDEVYGGLMKNVQTRIPLSVYEKLNRIKYFSGKSTTIGDLVAQAVREFVERAEIRD